MRSLLHTFLILLLLALASCSQLGEGRHLKKRNLNEYFVGSGVVQYFLPAMPAWANVSLAGQCRRQEQMRYLQMENVKKSFYLDYKKLVHFQHMYNYFYYKKRDELSSSFLSFKDEEKLFYDISDKVDADLFVFRAPKFKRVHLIWVDPFINNQLKLKLFMARKDVREGHPVFVSLCLSYMEMDSLVKNLSLVHLNIRNISYEFFTPFSEEGEMGILPKLNLSKLFFPKQQLYLFLPKGESPEEFEGKFTTVHY